MGKPGGRPPGAKPPNRPRPPGYRPPHTRPPAWRPPYYKPPYYRPPHYHWGNYYYSPFWGWFFTAALVSSTLVFVSDLPSDKECQKIVEDGETLYLCDGVLYRSTYYEDERVYEIVSDPPDAAEPETVLGLALTDPMTRGAVVKELQTALIGAGYDVGTADGVFGSATETAVMWYQYDNGLEPTGVVDVQTAELLGFDVPGTPGTDGDVAVPATTEADPAPTADPAEEEAPKVESPATQEGADQ